MPDLFRTSNVSYAPNYDPLRSEPIRPPYTPGSVTAAAPNDSPPKGHEP